MKDLSICLMTNTHKAIYLVIGNKFLSLKLSADLKKKNFLLKVSKKYIHCIDPQCVLINTSVHDLAMKIIVSSHYGRKSDSAIML